MTVGPAAIALNRFGLGARAGDRVPGDPRRWLLGQFADYQPLPPTLAAVPTSRQAIAMLADAYQARIEDRQLRRDQSGQPALAPSKQAPPAMTPAAKSPAAANAGAFRPVRDSYVDAIGARTNTALVSDTPFAERLVAFWSNHFALSVDRQEVIGLAGPFEVEAIRPHIFGRFSDMLMAVESHPAMLLYLDQAQSIGPDSMVAAQAAMRAQRAALGAAAPTAAKPKRGLNENLAREIMELHTLGVRSGYTQADVTEFARALTGWTVAGVRPAAALQGVAPGFVYTERFHEPGPCLIMGKLYRQTGEAQARAVLADLARNRATATHIATKLARHFAADDPPPALVARLTQAYLASDGDLSTIYRALIDAPEPWAVTSGKFRTPWLWGIAAMRACGIGSLPSRLASGLFDQLGQQIWKPGSPAGYDDIAASWAAPDALLRRVEAANRLASQAGGQAGMIDARALADRLFPQSLGPATRNAIAQADSPAQALALLLVSPEMMRS